MRKDFVEYMPYIVVSILVVTCIVIFKRGIFSEEPLKAAISTPISIVSPSNLPSSSPTVSTELPPTTIPQPTLAPTATSTISPIITKPSINGSIRRGDDD